MFIYVDLKLLSCPISTSELIGMLLLVAVTLPTEVIVKYVIVQCVCVSGNAIWDGTVFVFTAVNGKIQHITS